VILYVRDYGRDDIQQRIEGMIPGKGLKIYKTLKGLSERLRRPIDPETILIIVTCSMCDSVSSVASGIGEWLHNGRGHSYPAGHRHRRGTDPGDSGAKSIVAIWTLAGEGELFGKEVLSRLGNIL